MLLQKSFNTTDPTLATTATPWTRAICVLTTSRLPTPQATKKKIPSVPSAQRLSIRVVLNTCNKSSIASPPMESTSWRSLTGWWYGRRLDRWEEQWESFKVNESKATEKELDDEDRQAWFWKGRPDGFAVNEKEHIMSILEFKSVRRWGEVCCRDPESSRAPARCCNARP